MAVQIEGLRPASMEFTARPALRTTSRLSSRLSRSSYSRASSLYVDDTANPNLSIIEVEAKLREYVRNKYDGLVQAFQTYDVSQNQSVTKGEFRRVLETYCFPLTTEQAESIIHKVNSNPNGTVKYEDFLNKFSGRKSGRLNAAESNAMHGQGQGGQEANTDMLETMLKNKIKENLKNVIKALQLYDYNSDGHIQRHELRKVLENYCFKMTDRQFDKLYQRYDFHHRGLIQYKDFLFRLGVNVECHLNPKPGHALIWQQSKPSEGKRKDKIFRKPDEAQLAGMNFDQIELEFRKKMKSNYALIKKMFLAFDPRLEGFVKLTDLKSILSQFTIPLTDQLFSQLMDRCGVKASGKISWEYFLEKFQDAHSYANGQTIPIKPAHKYNPNMGVSETTNIREIIKMLDNHVKNAYGSFKKAFLLMDKTRTGTISRRELRDVVSEFKVRLTDGQFNELMNMVDPQHTNSISYHRFLQLFEPKEDPVEGHKWLNSTHKFNDVQKPAILAWETVEDILKEKIQSQWMDFSRAIVAKDREGSGRILPNQLRKILEKFCLPVSDEHFEALIQTVTDPDNGEADPVNDGKVSYMRFLHRLGVTIKPGDIEGVSTQIHQSNRQNEAQRKALLMLRERDIEQNAHHRTQGMEIEEVIVRIKDKIHQNQVEFRNAFKKYDIRRKGKVSKRDFRQAIEDVGIYMNDDQFKELCSALNFTNGHMTYTNFVENFNDLRIGGPPSELIKGSNHRVNKIRGDEYGMSAQEVEVRLRNKLRENFEDLRGAFYKFDDTHRGMLSRKNFRRMLDAFMIFMNNEEYEKLCQRLSLEPSSKLSYVQFLEKFEVKDTAEGHKWLKSVHTYNETKPTPMLTATQVHQQLAIKVHRQYKDIAKTFRTMDSNGKGVIKKSDLRELLYKFMLPISEDEFKKLWTMYDKHGKGYLNHADFVQQLTGKEFTSGDMGGTSHNIIQQSHEGLEQHHRNQQAKHEQITMNQATTAVVMSVDNILQQLKDRMRDAHKDFQSAFKIYDKKSKGFLSVSDIQRLLVDFNYFLDDDQYYDLLERLGVSAANSKLYYEDFLAAFEEGRADAYDPKQAGAGFAKTSFRTSKLSSDQADEKMRKAIEQQLPVVQAALQSFDPDYSGRIRPTDFRRVLDNFCFKMTEPQFKHFMQQVPLAADNSVDYAQFLEDFLEPDLEAKRWTEAIGNMESGSSPKLMTLSQVQEILKEKVTANFVGLSTAFGEVDYARIGVISKDDFKKILYKHTVRLTDEQFEALWNIQKINEFGNIEYHEFLRRYCIEKKPPTPMIRPSTGMSAMSFRSRNSVTSRSGERPFTPLVNAQSAEKAVQGKIQRHYKEIQRQCREYDTNNTGTISPTQFKAIMKSVGADYSEEDMRNLLLKYDLKNNYSFCYSDFLRHNLTQNMRREHTVAGTTSRAGSRTPLPTIRDDGTGGRLAKCVQDNWKEMRRQFRHLDPSGAGVVSEDDFRDVMRNNKLDATENEFFDITLKYDKDRKGQISYNDFLKAYL